MHKALKLISGVNTVPVVYINANLIGGDDETEALFNNG